MNLMSLAAEAEARQKLLHRSHWRSPSTSYSHSGASSSSTSADNSGPAPMEINATALGTNTGVFKGICYKCKERGHKAADCKNPPKKQSIQPPSLPLLKPMYHLKFLTTVTGSSHQGSSLSSTWSMDPSHWMHVVTYVAAMR